MCSQVLESIQYSGDAISIIINVNPEANFNCDGGAMSVKMIPFSGLAINSWGKNVI